MGRPKGSRSTRRRLLEVSKRTELLLAKVDEQLATGAIDVKLLTLRQRMAGTLARALRDAEQMRPVNRRAFGRYGH